MTGYISVSRWQLRDAHSRSSTARPYLSACATAGASGLRHLRPFNRIRDAPESRRSVGEGPRSVLAGHERRDWVERRLAGFEQKGKESRYLPWARSGSRPGAVYHRLRAGESLSPSSAVTGGLPRFRFRAGCTGFIRGLELGSLRLDCATSNASRTID